MYCPKCNLEVSAGEITVCPLCNSPLIKNSHEHTEGEQLSEEDLQLRELITEIRSKVKESLGEDRVPVEPVTEEAHFDLEKELSQKADTNLGDAALSSATEKPSAEFEKIRETHEKKIIKIEPGPLASEPVTRKSQFQRTFGLLLLLAVIAAGAAGYLYYSQKEQTSAQKGALVAENELPLVPQGKIEAPPRPAPPSDAQNEQAAPAVEQTAQQPVAPVSEIQKEQPAAQTSVLANQEPKPPESIPAAVTPDEGAALKQEKKAPVSVPAEQPGKKKSVQKIKTASAGAYTIIVGSFKMKESADAVSKSLKSKGYDASVQTVVLKDKGAWHRVAVGSFTTRQKAKLFAKQLVKKEKFQPMVVKKN